MFSDEPLRAKLQACERSIQKNIRQAELEEQRRREEEQQAKLEEQRRKEEEQRRFWQEAYELAERKRIEEEKRKQAAEAEQRRIAAEAQKKREAELEKQRKKVRARIDNNIVIFVSMVLGVPLILLGFKGSVNDAKGFLMLATISGAVGLALTICCFGQTIGTARTLVMVARIPLAVALVCVFGFGSLTAINSRPEDAKGLLSTEVEQKIQLVDDKLAEFFGIETDAAPEDFSALDTRLNVGDTIAFGRYEQDNNTSFRLRAAAEPTGIGCAAVLRKQRGGGMEYLRCARVAERCVSEYGIQRGGAGTVDRGCHRRWRGGLQRPRFPAEQRTGAPVFSDRRSAKGGSHGLCAQTWRADGREESRGNGLLVVAAHYQSGKQRSARRCRYHGIRKRRDDNVLGKR